MRTPNRRPRRGRRARRARRQAGQSLVLALGLLLAGGAALHAMFGAGQVAAARQRLADAADAAAWSAALWRARVLNYHAYSNRAIVANEVAIAQAATLLSWAKYFETLTRNAADIATVFPPARAVLEGVAEAAELAREAAELAAEIEIPARGAATVGYKEILATSQEILQLSAGGFGASMVAAEVARANDPSYFAWVLPDTEQAWQQLTRRAETVDERRRLADLVVASLDPFTRGPRDTDVPSFGPPCLLPARLRKLGATTLSDDLDRWQAVDTLSLTVASFRGLRCRQTEVLPLGWGAVEVGTELGDVVGDAGGIGANPIANRLAGSEIASFGSYAGIARTRELDYERLANTRFPTTRLAVLARQPGAAVATSMSRGLASGRMLPPDRFAGDGDARLWALSAAEVYFRRPVDAPQRLEYASLFNPYWQVRLASPTPVQRAAALAHVR